jgi:hypothetical protein
MSAFLSANLPAVAAALIAVPLYAQDAPEPRWRDCPRNSRGALVKGRVINDSTGKPIPTRGVLLVGVACFAVTDSSGEFAFERLRAGQYYLKAGDLGYRRFHPIRLDLAGDTTVDVTIRLRPENLLADCEDVAHCRELLSTRDTASSLSVDESLRETALRTTIALTAAETDSAPRWVACIDDPSPAVIATLQRHIPNVVAVDGCNIDVKTRRRVAVTVRRTNAAARLFKVDGVMVEGADRAWSNTHFYVGPLWAAGWRCAYVRESNQWKPTSCSMTWIS